MWAYTLSKTTFSFFINKRKISLNKEIMGECPREENQPQITKEDTKRIQERKTLDLVHETTRNTNNLI